MWEAKIEQFVKHDIFAGNLVLGQSLLFTLSLPPEWQLTRGVSHPEVNATHRDASDQAFVVNGNAWYVVYDGNRNWALELTAAIRPLSRNRVFPESEPINISGHHAHLFWKTRRRGLPWKRHDVKFMTVIFDCLRTERSIKLEFSGWCPPEGFQEILKALRWLKCH